ncbi:MAG: isopentenyl phosphate kinase [Nanoarchaeota archaeon]|nr:isopentenyl phosphate kinase family protein [Nanoarchaeota archaeon]MBU4300115.1 isopentenyl phosphate kinase family protein [Nanoarchaeota archaeon]MBU4452317.1 isopentenyl phosphate kinase family protein [Nanoarchaeota archaeon]MCG2723843.1 isopentenyl phosphate kinase family protein [archaeon]
MKEVILLKIGGSLITDKAAKVPKVNQKNLARISKEISQGFNPEKQILAIVHGAGSFGHVIVKETGIHKGISNKEHLLAFAETQRLQNELNSDVCKELIKNKIPAMPFEPASTAVMDEGRLISLDTGALEGMLKIGLVPVLYGVPAYDIAQGCSILSGDQIITYLAKRLKASRIILATDVDGVFDADPNKNPKAKLIKEISRANFAEIARKISGSTNTDVTGGMFAKVKEIFEINGLTGEIINGNKQNNIKRALHGEKGIGTLIKA